MAHTFDIYVGTTNRHRVHSLSKCFLQVMTISLNNVPITMQPNKNGPIYTVIYDELLAEAESRSIPSNGEIPVICSFQQHTDGYFAIPRLYDASFKSKKRRMNNGHS